VTSGDSICIWGAQLEAGAFETSYIPTVASQVTRAADLATVATSPWFTAASGTIFNQNLIAQTRATGTYTVFTIGTSTTNELRQRYISGGLQQQIVETSQTFNQGITPVANTVYRQAMAFEVDNAASSTNGSAATTDTSVTLPTGTLTTAYIGMTTTSISQLSGWLQAIKFYPARLQNGRLASLSAGGGPWYALSATMTEGSAVVGFDVYAGFSSSFGSMSSTSITGGLTLAGVFNVTGATNYASVVISGFTSDPGQTPFSKIAVGPIVQSFASASSYSYDGGSGTATWVWSGSTFSLDGSGTSAVVINR
jgi:hypothetical protein